MDGEAADFERTNLLGDEAIVVAGSNRIRRAEDESFDRDAGDFREDVRFVGRARAEDLLVVGVAELLVGGSGVHGARDEVARHPIAADFHRTDLCVGILRDQAGVEAGEDIRELDASADDDPAEREIDSRRGNSWPRAVMTTGEKSLVKLPTRPPLTVSEPMSLPARIEALFVMTPLLASIPEMMEPPTVTLAMRPKLLIDPVQSLPTVPVTLPPMMSWPIFTAPIPRLLSINPLPNISAGAGE